MSASSLFVSFNRKHTKAVFILATSSMLLVIIKMSWVSEFNPTDPAERLLWAMSEWEKNETLLLGTPTTQDAGTHSMHWHRGRQREAEDRSKADETDDELQELYEVMKTRLQDYKHHLYDYTRDQCSPDSDTDVCWDASCPSRFSPSLKERLKQLLSVRAAIPAQYLQALTSAARAVTSHKYILVTAASSNHYEEMQAGLLNVFSNLLPKFRGLDYVLVVYNIGLTERQRNLTQKNCRCTVLDFPFSSLPDFMSQLSCYIWKPLIVQSLLEKAEYLAWFDTSIRFKQSYPILELFQRARRYGYQTRSNRGSIAVRTRPSAAAFFGDRLCQYSPFGELETGFFIIYNDRFTREAVMRPWLSCAFNTTCMCDNTVQQKDCSKVARHYGDCHRWEQSTIGMIFSRLYLGYRPMLTRQVSDMDVDRDTKMNWFRD